MSDSAIARTTERYAARDGGRTSTRGRQVPGRTGQRRRRRWAMKERLGRREERPGRVVRGTRRLLRSAPSANARCARSERTLNKKRAHVASIPTERIHDEL